jgi:integrase
VVFGWAVENRKLVANPATGVTVRVPKRQKLRGASFTPAEVRTILQASLSRDQGRISPEHALARRWVPWLCAYSGARVGEIAQMRGSDIIQMEGIWVMLRRAKNNEAGLDWVRQLLTRRPGKVVAIAMANKTARVAFALLSKGEVYRKPAAMVA